MGHIVPTPSGNWRANWRDPTGRQKSKTFPTKKAARAYLADVETTVNRGTYVDPYAGRTTFGTFTTRWLPGRRVEARTAERTRSFLRTHILPRWRDWPLNNIDYMDVQEWVATLGENLAPATVRKCHGLFCKILKSAVRARLIAVNPAEGIDLPSVRTDPTTVHTITRADLFGKLLSAVPPRHRPIVCTAAGAGLRWGECAGLPWSSIDWNRWDHPCEAHTRPFCSDCLSTYRPTIRVVQVAVETPTAITLRPYPKTRAGVRTVPMPPFLARSLRQHRQRLDYDPDPRELVFPSILGGPLRRSNFRRRIWRPSLVRAGLLGRVDNLGEHKYRAVWLDHTGTEWSAEFTTEREAISYVASRAIGALRFHDLRGFYATVLITRGLPVNDVQDALGHERASTTWDLYTHRSEGRDQRIRDAFTDDPLTQTDESTPDLDDYTDPDIL